jgi:membrane protease YdiL (CAAX protease family)
MAETSEATADAPAVATEKPIGLADILIAVMWYLVITVGVSLAVGLATAAVLFAVRPAGSIPGAIAGLQTNFYFIGGTTAAADALVLWALWQRAIRFTPRPMARFFPAAGAKNILAAAATGLLLFIAFSGAETGLETFGGIRLEASAVEMAMMPHNWLQLAIALSALALFVPFFEEVLFRGYLLGWLRGVMPSWLAIVTSAAVFAAAHGLYAMRGGVSGWVGTAEIFILGVAMAWWAVSSGSLRTSFVIHAVSNGLVFVISYFLPSWP